jgi:hypothetical protein
VPAVGGVVGGEAQIGTVEDAIREQPVEGHPEGGGSFYQAAAEVVMILEYNALGLASVATVLRCVLGAVESRRL